MTIDCIRGIISGLNLNLTIFGNQCGTYDSVTDFSVTLSWGRPECFLPGTLW